MRHRLLFLSLAFLASTLAIVSSGDPASAVPPCDPAGSMMAKKGLCSTVVPTVCQLGPPDNAGAVTPTYKCVSKDYIILAYSDNFSCEFALDPLAPPGVGSLCALQWTMTPGDSPLRVPVLAPCIKKGTCILGIANTPGGTPPCFPFGTFDTYKQVTITSNTCRILNWPYYES